jgi:4-hydroxybenzoate polyprenyltransferase
MRPRQWTKNLIVFVPLIFAGELTQARAVLITLAAFAILCLVSGAVYIINDIVDVERDRNHCTKRERPIAAGELNISTAIAAAVVIITGSLIASFVLGVTFGFAILGYLVLQLAYSLWLKNQVILDVMAIAAGFVLRAVAGAEAISVKISPWLIMCAALLALFLGFAKRRHELIELDEGAIAHRPVLEHYSAELLDSAIATVASATIIAYALYTFFSPVGEEQGGWLMLTAPFVAYGIFRYLYLVHLREKGGVP